MTDRAAIASICLALPAATLDHPFGDDHDVFKVDGKMFAMVGGDGGLSFKASDIAYEVLTASGDARPAPYLARARWVRLPDPAAWDLEMLVDHLSAAHGLVAAKLTRKARAALGL